LTMVFSLAACGASQNNETIEAQTTVQETTTEAPTRPADKTGENIYTKYNKLTPVNYDSKALLRTSEEMNETYMDSIVYLCDSTNYWLGDRGLVKKEQIWTGKEGTQTLAYWKTMKIYDNKDKVEMPILEMYKKYKPERTIIALGTNGLDFMKEEEFISIYTDLVNGIKEASPDTDILCQSMYPMTPKMLDWSKASFNNEDITKGNGWILGVCEKTNVKYLDTCSIFWDEATGNGKEDYYTDGLHPTKDAQELIMKYIRTHAKLADE
ncbi:MAG: hypothetical protein KBT46_02395, partial [Ruminococcus sp.]|nr:hypothetical protein [Candidatus Copronaster equi]